MRVGCAQPLKQGNGLWKGLDALHRAIGHVDRGLALSTDLGDVYAASHQIRDQDVVAPRGGVVDRAVPIVVTNMEVGSDRLDQESDGK